MAILGGCGGRGGVFAGGGVPSSTVRSLAWQTARWSQHDQLSPLVAQVRCLRRTPLGGGGALLPSSLSTRGEVRPSERGARRGAVGPRLVGSPHQRHPRAATPLVAGGGGGRGGGAHKSRAAAPRGRYGRPRPGMAGRPALPSRTGPDRR